MSESCAGREVYSERKKGFRYKAQRNKLVTHEINYRKWAESQGQKYFEKHLIIKGRGKQKERLKRGTENKIQRQEKRQEKMRV